MKLRSRHMITVVLSFFALLTLACGGPNAARNYTTCACGTPEHDVLGCTHECCESRGYDCGNPMCTCAAKASPRAAEGKR
jgi:hypothetical protein